MTTPALLHPPPDEQLDGRLVVGVDASDAALHALRWAVDWGRRRGADLVVTHAVPPIWHAAAFGVRQPTREESVLADSAERIAAHIAPVLQEAGAHDVPLYVWESTPADALVQASRRAALVVVGTRGQGAIAGALLGSTSDEVVTYAHGSVAVVNEGAPMAGAGALVVGVDGGEESQEALRYAVAAALDLGAPLHALVAVENPLPMTASGLAALPPNEELLQACAANLEETLEPYRQAHPDLPITSEAKFGPPSLFLREYPGSSAIVVGNRGRGAWARLLLGSTSRGLAQHSPVATIVVRAGGAG